MSSLGQIRHDWEAKRRRAKLPRATVGRSSKPALWRRVLVWLQAKRITSTCAVCSHYSSLARVEGLKVTPKVLAMLHSAHLYTDRVETLIRAEAAAMPTPGDGTPRKG